MKTQTMLEILDSAHLTKYVKGPFPQRGGMFLIGPPGSLRTTFMEDVLENHPDALVVGDLNIQTLLRLRSDFRSGRYSTLAFTEFAKLYARRADTAANVEMAIQQLVEEGYRNPSFNDQRMSVSKSRCFVVAAITEAFYAKKFSEWEESGFLRRFLWVNVALANGHLLMDAVARWQLLDLGNYQSKTPGNKFIPMHTTEGENHELRVMLKEQPGETTPFVLMKKMLSVLKWKYAKQFPRKPMEII